ncbi:MAG: hypothetical protein ACM3N4_12480, partial [Nitrososphaerota archaeon]
SDDRTEGDKAGAGNESRNNRPEHRDSWKSREVRNDPEVRKDDHDGATSRSAIKGHIKGSIRATPASISVSSGILCLR